MAHRDRRERGVTSRGLWLLVAMSLIIGPAGAQAPTAERPVWKVGDRWAYHAVSGLPPVESNWSREVTASRDDGKFSVMTEAGRTLVFDGETNSLDSRGSEYSWKRFDFPLSVGKQWKHSRRLAGGTRDGIESASWEVKAFEKLTVPAGTFDCFRVHGVVWQSWTQAIYGPSNGHEDMTYWYCPAVKWVAKWQSHRTASQYSPYINSESVLTSFTVAD